MKKQFNIEDKISKIRQTLSQLGNELQASQDIRISDPPSLVNTQPLDQFLQSKYQDNRLDTKGSSKFDSSRIYVSDYVVRGKSPAKSARDNPLLNVSTIKSQIDEKSFDLKENVWDLKFQLDAEKDRSNKLEQRIKKKEDLLNETGQIQNDLYTQISDLKQQCDQLRSKNEKFSQLEFQNSLLKKHLEQSYNEKSLETTDNKQLGSENEILKQRVQHLQSQEEQYIRQIKHLNLEKQELQNQLQLKEDNLRFMETKIKNLENKLNFKDQELTNLLNSQSHYQLESQAFNSSQSEFFHLNKENEKLQIQSEELQQRLLQKENELTRALDKLEISRLDLNSLSQELNSYKEKVKYGNQFVRQDNYLMSDKQEILILRNENETHRKEIYQLKEENSQLKRELESRPTLRRVQENEQSIKELEKQLNSILNKSHSSTSRKSKKQVNLTFDSSVNKRKSKSRSKSGSYSFINEKKTSKNSARDINRREKESQMKSILSFKTIKSILDEIQVILNVQSETDIVPVLKQQKDFLKNLNQSKKFIQRTQELVIQLSPPNTFKQLPSLKQI